MASSSSFAFVILVFAGAFSACANASQALASGKNCMACHSADKKLVGPSFREIADRYKDQAGAADLLGGKIVKGGSGAWGPVPMPAQPQVNAQEASSLAAWILEQR